MSWEKVASGLFASHPDEVEGPVRVVASLDNIVSLMKEPPAEPAIIVTNVAGGSAVSTIIRRAKAIVSTIGGPKSHIVVVARDYNMPCIVGAGQLDIAALANGTRMRLRPNGDVEVHSSARATEVTPDIESLRLLRAIIFSGAVADLADLTGLAPGAEQRLAALVAAGLVEADGAIRPTTAGVDALEAWYTADREGLNAATCDAIISAFRPLDLDLKHIASVWQQAEAKDDWNGRLKAIEALSSLHDRTLAFLESNASRLPRFLEYGERLRRAHDRIVNGETEYFTAVNLDSYHTVWFNLHEDLLRLLQRERDAE